MKTLATVLLGTNVLASSDLTRFTKSLQAAPLVLLYEGLPHQTWEPIGLANELLHKRWVTVHAFPFYESPLAISNTDQRALRELLSDPSIYALDAGGKLCGEFHPDFTVVWRGKKQICSLHLCMGCNEAKFTEENRSVHCGIQPACWTPLWDIWRPCARQRPPSRSMETAWKDGMRNELRMERKKRPLSVDKADEFSDPPC